MSFPIIFGNLGAGRPVKMLQLDARDRGGGKPISI